MKKMSQNKQKKNGADLKRRRLHPDARRVELLEAALRVLRDRGPVNARVEDVTDAAGVAKGTFYLYFPSWDDLLVEVRAYILSNYVAQLRKRFTVEALSGWWAALEKECVHFVDFVEELGDLHEAIFHGRIADRPFDAAISHDTVLSWMLRTGIESGACRCVEVDIAARLLFSVLHTTVDNIARTGDRERHLNAMFDLLRRWLCSEDHAVA